jgi:serine/threonine protein kinase
MSPPQAGGELAFCCAACGAVEAAAEWVPAEWVLRRLLRAGGLGALFAARHRLTDEEAELLSMPGVRTDNADFASWFRQEVGYLKALTHPGIVRLLYAGVHEGRPWLALEPVPSRTLARFVAEARPDARELLRLMCELLEVLEHVHAQGLTHGALELENVLVDGAGRVRLAGFGLASLQLTEGGRQAAGGLDGDLRAAGHVLVELLMQAGPQASGSAGARFNARAGPILADLLTPKPLLSTAGEAARQLREVLAGLGTAG